MKIILMKKIPYLLILILECQTSWGPAACRRVWDCHQPVQVWTSFMELPTLSFAGVQISAQEKRILHPPSNIFFPQQILHLLLRYRFFLLFLPILHSFYHLTSSFSHSQIFPLSPWPIFPEGGGGSVYFNKHSTMVNSNISVAGKCLPILESFQKFFFY